jgi:hypothetical protein
MAPKRTGRPAGSPRLKDAGGLPGDAGDDEQGTVAVVLTRRVEVFLWVVGAALGLALAYVATEFDLPITGGKPAVSGSGFVFLVVLGIVGLASLVSAMRQGRARRAGQHQPGEPGLRPD